MVMDTSKEWKELMGKDLRLRINSSSNASERDVEVGDVVKFNWVGYHYENSVIEDVDDIEHLKCVEFCTQEGWVITIGKGDVEPALEMGLRFMTCNQNGTIVGHPKYGYGMGGLSVQKKNSDTIVVPSNSYVRFDVTLLSVIKSYELTGNHSLCIEHALSQKQIGNFYFGHAGSTNRSLYMKACRIYCNAVEMLKDAKLHEVESSVEDGLENDTNANFDSDLRFSAQKLIIDCLNNAAMANMKLKEYRLVKEICGEIIQFYDKDNLKALCRAAQASILEGSFDEAKVAVEAALDVDSKHPDSKRVERMYIKSKRNFKLSQKALFSKMGSSFVSKPKEVEVAKETEGADIAPVSNVTAIEKSQFPFCVTGGITLVCYLILSYVMYRLHMLSKTSEL